MTWFFTADLHFDHSNIIDYCQRPFQTVKEMNEKLISNWNITVRSCDVIVVAGDLTLHTNATRVYEKFIRRLNGTKIFLKGNHDY
jgi:calcineurin-like phosphoesterase family protein